MPAPCSRAANLALDAGRLVEAEDYLRRALALAPDELAIHLALSRCLRLAGNEPEASRHQERYYQLQSARAARERRTGD